MFKYAPKHEMQGKIDETIRNMDIWLLNPYNALQPWSNDYEISKEERDDGTHYLIKNKLKDRVVCEFYVAKEANIYGDFITMHTIANDRFIDVHHDDEPIKDEASLRGIVSDLKEYLFSDAMEYSEYTHRRPTGSDRHYAIQQFQHRFLVSIDEIEYIVECYNDTLDLSILTSDMIISKHVPLSKAGWEQLRNHLKMDLHTK